MGLQTVANQFLTMVPLEYGVANSCKSVSKYGTVGTWGCKELQISFKIWRSEERRVGKSVDLGGRRIIKKKKK